MPALLMAEEGGATVILADGEGGVAPGQACVFYDAADPARVLGGGWIARTQSEWQIAPDTAGFPLAARG